MSKNVLSLNEYSKHIIYNSSIKVSLVSFGLLLTLSLVLTFLYTKDKTSNYLRMNKSHITYLMETSDIIELNRMLSNRFVDSGQITRAHIYNPQNQKISVINGHSTKDFLSIELNSIKKFSTNAGQYVIKLDYIFSLIPFVLTFFGCLIYFLFSNFLLRRAIRKYSKSLLDNYRRISSVLSKEKQYLTFNSSTELLEVNEIISEIVRLRGQEATILNQEKLLAKEELARTISHDLQSKISTSKNILKYFSTESNDEIRISKSYYSSLVTSLNTAEAIVSNIKRDNIQQKMDSSNASFFVPYAIDSLINSKVIEYRNNDVGISAHLSNDVFDSFINLDIEKFDIILSNLINNSIDALKDSSEIKKYVNVLGRVENEMLILDIVDNGCGFDSSTLSDVFTNGYTTKEQGTGRGLYYAKKELKMIGGNINILKGDFKKETIVRIKIPVSIKNHCLQRVMKIDKRFSKVIYIDDEKNYIDRVENRVGLSFQYYDTVPIEFDDRAFYIVDLDLDKGVSGLKLILDNGLENRSLLLTNRADDPKVVEACKENNVSLWHKNYIEHLEFEKYEEVEHRVYVDDDPLLLKIAISEAKKRDLSLQAFSNPEEFLNCIDDFHKNTKFYIDYNLTEDICGDDLAKKLFNEGFENIYSYTFESLSEESRQLYTGIISKSSPANMFQ